MNLNYKISTIAKAINGTLVSNSEDKIKTVFIDSRSFFDAKTSLFFALEGKHNNGHNYIEELYQKGLRYFVVKNTYPIPKLNNAIFIKVENTLESLQQLAIFHRSKFNLPIIAITGSNGKTIVKEWLYAYLRNDYNIVRSPKSYNSQVGVPLSVLEINKQHTLGIFEAGISLPNEMQQLEKIIQPDYGILSKLGTAHLENFKNKAHLEKEKLKLFKNAKWYYDYSKNTRIEPNRLNIIQIEIREKHTVLHLEQNKTKYKCNLPFVDKASIENACTCIRFLNQFNVPTASILEQTPKLTAIAFRLETHNGINKNTIIRDNYNSNLTSLSIALDYTQRFKNKRQIVILTDILQDKIPTQKLYNEIADLINQRSLTAFVGIGKNMVAYQKLFNKGIFYTTIEEYLENNNIQEITNSCILIKGTKSYRLDKINALLLKKTHQTTLEINLTALLNNINYYKRKLNPATKIMCMVKAFGYGSGSREISTILQHANIDYLGVAYTDEGVELRKQKIDVPIVVMNMEESSYQAIIDNYLEPSIYSFHQLENFIHFLIDKNIKSYPIHLKIDTGMHRLGFIKEEIKELIATIINQPEIYVKGIFSHLAVADDKNEDSFTLKQIKTFKKVSQQIEENLGYSTIKHILNSAGIERFSAHQFNMVRLGIGMYGISNSKALEPVSTLKTKISQIKVVKKGESIGYGRSVIVKKDTLIGVIPIGYADGFLRMLSNGKGSVLVNGKKASVIGRVSMDMTTIDVSKIPYIKEGDEVEIFGKNRPIEELATEMNTIAYEVLTAVSSRVVRTYLEF